jgi:Trk K+ transport system NAD-binding subunit
LEEFTQEEEFQTKNTRLQELNAIFAVEDTTIVAVGDDDEEISMSEKTTIIADNSEKNSAKLEM